MFGYRGVLVRRVSAWSAVPRVRGVRFYNVPTGESSSAKGAPLDKARLQEISSLSKTGDFARALTLLEEAHTETAHRLRGYHLVAFQYQGDQPRAMAEAVSDSMGRAGVQADQRLGNTLISTLCRHDQVDEALDMLAGMQQDGFPATIESYNPIVHALCRLDQYEQAAELLVSARCEGMEPDIITYATMVEHLCAKQRVEEALGLWARMRAKGVTPTLVIGHTLLQALGQAGRLDEALQLVQQMRESNMRPGDEQLEELKGHLLRAERVEDAVMVQQILGPPATPPIPDDVEEQYKLLLQVAGQYGVNEEQVQDLISSMRSGEINMDALQRAIKD